MAMIHFNDFDFNKMIDFAKKSSFTYGKYFKDGSLYYLNVPISFDIETTSTMVGEDKSGFMYLWQFGLGDDEIKIYGRTWEQFIQLMEKLVEIFQLDSKHIAIIYVHNLGFEFQFMKDLFTWQNVFATGERKPLKVQTVLGIEFRDSYILSGMSLEKTGENLMNHNIKKLVGDLDYSLIRTKKTPLTELEMNYSENDILIVCAYIQEQIEMYGDIGKIPLTNTGKVRKFVGDKCYFTNKSHKKSNTGKFTRYRKIMDNLQITNEDEYKMLKRAFSGGFTHANANHVNKILENVSSDDFTSSYPTVMLSEMFPMSTGFEVYPKTVKELFEMSKKHCMILDVKFTNIISKVHFEHYLSESKCYQLKNKIIDNGRIVKADSLITTITNIDLEIINQTYEWDTISIGKVIAYNKNYLPKPIIESVLELYQNKTTLKDVKGKEVEYMVSKGMINSTYGMCVTDIIQDNDTYKNGEWVQEFEDIDKQLEKYNKGKKRFLFYPWGVFITAYSRLNLWTGILNVKDDYVYSDTDSIKYLNRENHLSYFEKYNELITRKLYRMCDTYNIDKKLLSPKTIKGVSKPIGVWDSEGTYSRFKTLGAKRYLVEKDGELMITVAGLSKKNGLQYMLEYCNNDNTKVFNMFNDNLYIPSNRTGKLTHTYIDSPMEFNIQDYKGIDCHVKTLSGIHLSNCDFTLSLSKEYKSFIEKFIKGEVFKGITKTL